MTSSLPSVLERIVASKRAGLALFRRLLPQLEVQANEEVTSRRGFAGALRQSGPAIIAELKKASPSKGLLAPDYDPSAIALAYERGGAAALSVLTDTEFFQGSLQDLEAARNATNLPVLRKDFTIDRYHVVEAAAHGADAILLIAAILSDFELRDFRELAETFRMAALVEVHDEDELRRAVDSGARIVGVNNRDLHTFEVHLETALRLADKIPSGITRVAESGIRTPADVRTLADAGYNAFLVGEHLMTSPDPAASIRNLIA
jgi:indole-3-glycerol phosphate synthase